MVFIGSLIEDLCGEASVVGYLLLYLEIMRVLLVTPQYMCGKSLKFLNLYDETQLEHGMTETRSILILTGCLVLFGY